MFESRCGTSITEVLREEKGDWKDRLVLIRTDQIGCILQLWWCVRRTAGLYLYARDLDERKEVATAVESSLNSAPGV